VNGVAGYHDTQVNPTAAQLPGLVIYRFDGPLFFANANAFRDKVLQLAVAEPRVTWILVAAEPITDVDTTAADMLEDLDQTLNQSGISLVFAEMKTPVRLKVERYELAGVIEPGHFFGTVEEAVQAYQNQSGAEWVSGADSKPPPAGGDTG
jgi:MFS superfamily sulfate permease-like transporter